MAAYRKIASELKLSTSLPVEIVAVEEVRELEHLSKDEIALGRTLSRIAVRFPQTHNKFPAKTFVLEVPSEVVEEYAECVYDLYRNNHPDENLPDVRGQAPIEFLLKCTTR